MTLPHIDAIYLYPIKALRGVAVPTARAEARGFANDRRLMLVDPEGRFMTQRELPQMARIKVELWDSEVRLHAAGHGILHVPLRPEGSPSMKVQVWRSTVDAVTAGDEFDAWFTTVLGRPLRLVYMPDSVIRDVNRARVPEGGAVSFADGYPYLVVSRSAVDLVTARVGAPVHVEQFRPNLVVAGVPAHAEDDWRGFEVGDLRFDCVKPCDRCVVITRDPWTGAGSKEPLRTLAGYRRRDGNVLFGQNLMLAGTGEVQVGDRIRVLPKPASS